MSRAPRTGRYAHIRRRHQHHSDALTIAHRRDTPFTGHYFAGGIIERRIVVVDASSRARLATDALWREEDLVDAAGARFHNAARERTAVTIVLVSVIALCEEESR